MAKRRVEKSKEGSRALSYNELLVLQALSGGCQYGFEVMSRTGISAGTVYPILRRCEVLRFVSSEREDEAEAHSHRRPARRLHAITPEGLTVLARARVELLARQTALGLMPQER
jgi:DNA-binding PadR family transcriptional regulator